MPLLSRRSAAGCLVSTLLFSCLASAQSLKKPVDLRPKAVATFSGTVVTEQELREAAASDLDEFNLHIQQLNASMARAEHDILETNLIRLLADKMFAAEAAKRGITKEKLIETEIAGKYKEPTPEEVKAFYDANKERYNQPFEKLSDEIRKYLEAEHRNKAIGEFADRLKQEYGVSVLLPPLRANVRTDGSPSLGPKDAPVTMVVFSDFQSPYSLQLDKTLRQLVKKYGDQVRLVYRNFALPNLPPPAEKAAEASLCAADQNRFWEMHDLIFATQSQLKDADLKAKAAKLQLDSKTFDGCLSSGKYAEKVKYDEREGYILGVSATPALFINGRYLAGSLPLTQLSKTIDEEIRLKALKTAASPAPTAP